MRFRNLLRFDQNLADHRLHALHIARALAMRAGRAKRAFQALLHAFARDRHQPEIVELQNFVWRFIGAHGFFESLHDALAILALIHIDEVHHNDAAQIAQTNLPHNLLHRLDVGLDDGVFQAVGFADKLAGIDIDGHQRFGLIDDNIAAGFEPHFRPQRLFEFLRNVEGVEDRGAARVHLDAVDQRRLVALHEIHNALVQDLRYRPKWL